MRSYRSKVMGRDEDEEEQYETTTNLNIHSGPGTEHPTILNQPLPMGTRVNIISAQGFWMFVDVFDEVHGISDIEGWVHGKFLTAVT